MRPHDPCRGSRRRGGPGRPRPERGAHPPAHQLSQQCGQGSVKELGQVTAGDLVAQEVLALLQLGIGLRAGRELDTVARRRQGSDSARWPAAAAARPQKPRGAAGWRPGWDTVCLISRGRVGDRGVSSHPCWNPVDAERWTRCRRRWLALLRCWTSGDRGRQTSRDGALWTSLDRLHRISQGWVCRTSRGWVRRPSRGWETAYGGRDGRARLQARHQRFHGPLAGPARLGQQRLEVGSGEVRSQQAQRGERQVPPGQFAEEDGKPTHRPGRLDAVVGGVLREVQGLSAVGEERGIPVRQVQAASVQLGQVGDEQGRGPALAARQPLDPAAKGAIRQAGDDPQQPPGIPGWRGTSSWRRVLIERVWAWLG